MGQTDCNWAEPPCIGKLERRSTKHDVTPVHHLDVAVAETARRLQELENGLFGSKTGSETLGHTLGNGGGRR